MKNNFNKRVIVMVLVYIIFSAIFILGVVGGLHYIIDETGAKWECIEYKEYSDEKCILLTGYEDAKYLNDSIRIFCIYDLDYHPEFSEQIYFQKKEIPLNEICNKYMSVKYE